MKYYDNKSLIISVLILILFGELISCSQYSEKENSDIEFRDPSNGGIASIEVDTLGDKHGVSLAESTYDIYIFHNNAKLNYYYNTKDELLNGQKIEFYANGTVKSIYTYKNGITEGVKYSFYPSGNLKTWWNFKNDSLNGIFIEYYDKPYVKKAEYLAGMNSRQGHIYRRSFDSATQNIIDVHDCRLNELKAHPKLDPKSLQLPWEIEDWKRNK